MAIDCWLPVVVISILAGIDRTAAASTLVSRPIVCAPALGYMLGIFEPAFQLGLMLELLWLMRLPVGAAIAPDDTQASLAAVVLVKLFAHQLPNHHWELVITIAVLVIILAEVGKCCDVWARHVNERLFLRAMYNLRIANWSGMIRNHYSGLAVFAVSSVLSLTLIVAGGSAILWATLDYVDYWSALFTVREEWVRAVFPLVGVAAVLVVLRVKHTVWLFVAGYVVTYTALELL